MAARPFLALLRRHAGASLLAAILIGTLGAGLIAVVQHAGGVRWPGLRALLTQSQAREELSHALTQTPLTQAVARVQRQAQWLALRDTGPRVWRGARGWLFLADEMQPHAGADAHAALRAEAVVRVARGLERRGARLVVLAVPDKSRTEARHLGPLRRPAQLGERLPRWVAALRAQGVAVVDATEALAAPLPEPAFLRTDTHWSEAGSRAAAAALAPAIAQAATARARVDERERERAVVWGDLVQLAGLDALPERWRPAPDLAWHTRLDVRPEEEDDDDLLGDAGHAGVVLVGTSFSRRANFLPFLQQASGLLVAEAAMDGGGFSGAARRYLGSPAFTQAPPRVLVWEVAERTVFEPVDAQERAWLQQGFE